MEENKSKRGIILALLLIILIVFIGSGIAE